MFNSCCFFLLIFVAAMLWSNQWPFEFDVSCLDNTLLSEDCRGSYDNALFMITICRIEYRYTSKTLDDLSSMRNINTVTYQKILGDNLWSSGLLSMKTSVITIPKLKCWILSFLSTNCSEGGLLNGILVLVSCANPSWWLSLDKFFLIKKTCASVFWPE